MEAERQRIRTGVLMGCREHFSRPRTLVVLLLFSFFGYVSPSMSYGSASVSPAEPLFRGKSADLEAPLPRKKRYINFPTGSLFGMTVCLAKRTLIRYPDFYTFNFDLDVGYKLPNSTQYFLNRKKREGISAEDMSGAKMVDEEEEASILQHRRDRRAIYSQVEGLLEALGLDGRECVLRTICEAKQVLVGGGTLMEDVFRAMFNMPQLGPGMQEDFLETDINGNYLNPAEDEKNSKEYDAAQKLGATYAFCDQLFPLCTVSLLEVALW